MNHHDYNIVTNMRLHKNKLKSYFLITRNSFNNDGDIQEYINTRIECPGKKIVVKSIFSIENAFC